MADPASQEAQLEAARLRTLVQEVCQGVEARMDSIPMEEKDPADEMYDWEVCPTVPFYVHGALVSALDCLREAEGHLSRAAGATAESVADEWRRYQEQDEEAARALRSDPLPDSDSGT